MPRTGYSTQEDPIGVAGGVNLYGYAGGDPINNHDPFGLSSCEKDMSDEQRAECERAAAEAAKARATVTAACSADLKQATLSTFTSVVQIGALKYARNLWSLARSEAAWTNPAVTNSAVANFSLLPGATAMGKGVARQGGTANPFDGNAAVAYEFFSGLPVVGAGLKLGEAINSCIAAGSATP